MNRWLLRPRVLAVLACATFACILLYQLPWSPAASAHFTAHTGQPPFDERPAGYSLSGVLRDFRRLGAEGLQDYRAYRVLDLLFPWLLCALVAGVMLRLDAARATMWAWLAALADSAENAALWAMYLTRDDLSPRLVPVASFLTQLKFFLYAAMLLMLLAVGVRFVLRERRRARMAE